MNRQDLARTLLASTFALAAAGASAQSATLRLADSLPATHVFTKMTTQPFMERVKERTKGEVTLQHFPAQQLGKAADMLTLTTTGVADISLMVPSYITDKFPLHGVAELPGNFTSSCDGAKALWALVQPGSGALYEREVKGNGIRVLYLIVQPPFAVFTSKQPIRSAGDFKGLKLRTTGAAMDMMLREMGGVPVRMPAPDVHESMSRGTIDGGILAHVSIKGYDLYKQIRYATKGVNYGSASLLYGISEARFNKLSPAAQKALLDVGQEVTFEACKEIDRNVQVAEDEMKAQGISFETIPASARGEVDRVLGNVATSWAKSMDERKLPGSEVLKAFQAQLK